MPAAGEVPGRGGLGPPRPTLRPDRTWSPLATRDLAFPQLARFLDPGLPGLLPTHALPCPPQACEASPPSSTSNPTRTWRPGSPGEDGHEGISTVRTGLDPSRSTSGPSLGTCNTTNDLTRPQGWLCPGRQEEARNEHTHPAPATHGEADVFQGGRLCAAGQLGSRPPPSLPGPQASTKKPKALRRGMRRTAPGKSDPAGGTLSPRRPRA